MRKGDERVKERGGEFIEKGEMRNTEGKAEGEQRVGCVEDYSACIELQLYCAVRCLWSLTKKTR